MQINRPQANWKLASSSALMRVALVAELASRAAARADGSDDRLCAARGLSEFCASADELWRSSSFLLRRHRRSQPSSSKERGLSFCHTHSASSE